MRRACSILLLTLVTLRLEASLAESRATLREQSLRRINEARATEHLPPLRLDSEASELALEYARLQLRLKTTGHFTTDGIPPYARYSFRGLSDGLRENAAAWSADYDFGPAALQEIVERSHAAMMAERPPDDGHRRAILDPHANRAAIGVAWDEGEFRLVQLILRRYVAWSRTLPFAALTGETVDAAGGVPEGFRIHSVTMHVEPIPTTLTASAASSIDNYVLPKSAREYLPNQPEPVAGESIRQAQRRHPGALAVDRSGRRFTLEATLDHGPGIYTFVVWIRREGGEPFAVTNSSLRVDR